MSKNAYAGRVLKERNEMSHSSMRFTTEQRLAALERENAVLHDTTRLLHRMLKEQQQLINDSIIQALKELNPKGSGRL